MVIITLEVIKSEGNVVTEFLFWDLGFILGSGARVRRRGLSL
jgi:hypothetical protein